MKKLNSFLIIPAVFLAFSGELFAQADGIKKEFGISAGSFTNFPANQNYLKESMTAFYVAPYIRAGKHEFTAGILYPLADKGLYFSDNNISPCAGFLAGYTFYLFNTEGVENLYIHYAFQYLRFNGSYDKYDNATAETNHWTEKDMYINNVIGLGYHVFFDAKERFGFYYTLDYVISQAGYHLSTQGYTNDSWATKYIWNNLSTHMGLSFKITSIGKKVMK